MKKRQKSPKNVFVFISIVLGVFIFLFLFYVSSHRLPCANSISCIKNLSGKYEEITEGIFLEKKVQIPSYVSQTTLPEASPSTLGETAPSNKRIYVDLTNQHLYAYEGNRLALHFPVSTGKWGLTPTGDFRIWIKLRYTRMTGGNPALGTYYNLPNVPHTMYFYNDQVPKTRGFGLHGAYWHNNFGHPMSHGCVNISLENAEKLYNWANPVARGNTTYATAEDPGTPITIFGETPKE